MKLGAHISIAGGVFEAVDRARRCSCDCMQIFSRSPRGWQAPELSKNDVKEFKRRRKEAGITPLVIHSPYLINLASPDKELYEKSLKSCIEELKRADLLGAEYFVTHLGSHKGAGVGAGVSRFGAALDKIYKELNPGVMILLENTAGGGNNLGGTFREINEVMKASRHKKRLGLCFDTCHAYAAGYDIGHKNGLEDTLFEIDSLMGLDKLRVIHLNDSKGDLGSHLDRHEHIGEGKIGISGFKVILGHPRLEKPAYIIETPKKGPDSDLLSIKKIRKIYGR